MVPVDGDAMTHLMDVLPTIVEATGAKYPKELGGNVITPIEGVSLLPLIQGQKVAPLAIGFDHQAVCRTN